MHIVYRLIEPGEEFRLSLRSVAANLPVDKITIVGDAPSWIKDIEVVPGNPTGNPHVNSVANAHIAARKFKGEILMMDDDFFVMKQVKTIKHWWYHSLSAHMGQYTDPRSQHWRQLYHETAQFLTDKQQGIPRSFELHLPMRVQGAELDKILSESAKDMRLRGPGLWRSLYGNLSPTVREEGIARREDVKVHSLKAVKDGADFLSTDERTARPILNMLRDRFPDRSPWEKR